MIAVNNSLAVSFKTRYRPDNGAGGDDDVPGLNGLLGTVFRSDLDLAGQCQFSRSFKHGAFVFLHKELDAFRVLHHDFVLSLLNVSESELDRGSLHAKIRGMLH